MPEAKTCPYNNINPFFPLSTSVFQIFKNEWDLNCGLGQPASSRGKKKAVAASAMNLANRIVGGYTARDRSVTNVLNNQGHVFDHAVNNQGQVSDHVVNNQGQVFDHAVNNQGQVSDQCTEHPETGQ